jgi:hypothetical protein
MFVLLIFAPALYIPFKCSSYNCRNHFPFQPTGYSFINWDVEVVAVSSKIKLYPKQRRGPRWVPKVKMNEVRNGGNQYQYSQFPPTTQPQWKWTSSDCWNRTTTWNVCWVTWKPQSWDIVLLVTAEEMKTYKTLSLIEIWYQSRADNHQFQFVS